MKTFDDIFRHGSTARSSELQTLGSFPNENVYALWSQEEYDTLDGDPIERHAIDLMFMRAPCVLRCAQCGRLHVNGLDGNEWVTYARTPDAPAFHP